MRRLGIGEELSPRATAGDEDERSPDWAPSDNPDLESLQPIAHPEVLFGLSVMSVIRGLAGFLVFLLAFGLRRENAGLEWYGLALGASGIGAMAGLTVVARLRKHLIEQQLLVLSLAVIGLAALGAAFWGVLFAQVVLSFMVGVAGSFAQPSFDAMTQRFVPVAAQGRTFAKFATRQQLVWVVGAIIPVVVPLAFNVGDLIMAIVAGTAGVVYVSSRRALKTRRVDPPTRLGPIAPTGGQRPPSRDNMRGYARNGGRDACSTWVVGALRSAGWRESRGHRPVAGRRGGLEQRAWDDDHHQLGGRRL